MDHNLDFLKQGIHWKTHEFIEVNLDNALLPVITKPTRISCTSATLMDNIFISEKFQNDFESSVLLTDLSDHLPCLLKVKDFNTSKTPPQKVTKRKLSEENLQKIKHDIESIDWETKINDLDANNSFDELHSTILNILNIHAPEKEVLIRPKRINKQWVSKGLANSIRKTKKLYQ